MSAVKGFYKHTLVFAPVLSENKLAQFELCTAAQKRGAERRVCGKIFRR